MDAGHFYGSAVSRESAGVIFSLVRHHEEAALPDHTHALPFACLLLDGRYVESAAGSTIEYEPLTLVYHPAGLAHHDRVFPESRMFTAEIGERWHPVLERCGAPLGSLFTLCGAEPLWIMLRLYELFRTDALIELTVESLLFELIGSFESLESPGATEFAPWLGEVRDYLGSHFADQIDVAQLARDFGVHPVHLSRSFRRHLKSSIGDYVHGRRIQRACRLLRSSRSTISEIALELGYFDQSHFTHVFTSFTGTTPARYRRASP